MQKTKKVEAFSSQCCTRTRRFNERSEMSNEVRVYGFNLPCRLGR
jgi:hypothetical protein